MVTFKYNNKIWRPKNPEKKLKQLGITWNDVEIIEEKEKIKDDSPDIDTDIILHHYKNYITKETIVSTIDNMKVNGYEQID